MSNEVMKKDEKSTQITQKVLKRIEQLQKENAIDIPINYSPANALQSAYLTLAEIDEKTGKSLLDTCTAASISNALLEMVVQGLNPIKSQVYFIPYGNILKMQRSYLGTIALTKRLPKVKDIKGYPVYKNDVFEMEFSFITGVVKVKKFVPSVDRNPQNLIGAFALIIGKDNDVLHTEYMDITQLKKSWEMGAMKGKSKAHENFPDQMAVKTVINRACKYYVDTSDDTGLISSIMEISANETDEQLKEDMQSNIIDAEIVQEQQLKNAYTAKDEKDQITAKDTTGEEFMPAKEEFDKQADDAFAIEAPF